MEKVKIAAVSYLNTKPFLFGIQHSPLIKDIDLVIDHPSRIAEELINGNADIGLIPVAIIHQVSSAQIISDYCIGCDGAVSSVCIYSEVPIEEIREIYLDYQSRTSCELAKVLMEQYWKIQPKQLAAAPGYESLISNYCAGLIIGDRALEAKNNFTYSYDLGEIWKLYTGLPFVFACWVMNKKLPGNFIAQFNDALQFGVYHIAAVADREMLNFPGVDVHDYLNRKIKFNFDAENQKALHKFLFLLKEKSEVIV